MPVAIVTAPGQASGKPLPRPCWAQATTRWLAGRRTAPLEEVAARWPDNTLVQATDVGDEAQVKALFEAAVARFGRVDLLFNNAGSGAPPVPLEELTLAQWQAVVDANLTGSFLCTREAFRVMKAQDPSGGRIINNGSISAHVPRPNSAPYTATKHGVTGAHPLDHSGRAKLRHNLRPDRHRQCRDADDAAHEEGRAPARRFHEGRAGNGRPPCRRCRALHGQPVAGRQCAVPDRDGERHALYRARLEHGLVVLNLSSRLYRPLGESGRLRADRSNNRSGT